MLISENWSQKKPGSKGVDMKPELGAWKMNLLTALKNAGPPAELADTKIKELELSIDRI